MRRSLQIFLSKNRWSRKLNKRLQSSRVWIKGEDTTTNRASHQEPKVMNIELDILKSHGLSWNFVWIWRLKTNFSGFSFSLLLLSITLRLSCLSAFACYTHPPPSPLPSLLRATCPNAFTIAFKTTYMKINSQCIRHWKHVLQLNLQSPIRFDFINDFS